MAPQLPGFYFDEEKKKYFKILPNHVAPSNAKYSQSNVKHEKRLAKKLKVANKYKKNLQSQTVLLAPVLKNSLLANGLDREYGFQSSPSSLLQREDVFLRGLRLNHNKYHYPNTLLDAHWLPDRMAIISAAGLFSCSTIQPDKVVTVFTTPSCSVTSSYMAVISGVPYLLGSNDGFGPNAFLVSLDDSQRTDCNWYVVDDLVDCAINQIDGKATPAFAGGRTVSTFTVSGEDLSSIDLPEKTSSNSVEWLGAHTLAYGTHEGRGKQKPSNHTVMLWDTRSPTAMAARFKRQKRITGLSTPDFSGNNLIVTSNYDISMYDLRLLKTDQPLLTIPHMSEGPVTYHATHNGSMLAAVDHRQEIQAYSWRTGKHVKTIFSRDQRSENSGGNIFRNVRWYEGLESPFLQVCCGNEVLRFEM